MKTYIIKKISIATTLLTMSSAAFANSHLDSRITQLETQMDQVRTETTLGTCGLSTPSAQAEGDQSHWSVSFAPLYWHTRVSGTDFAYTRQRDDFPVQATVKHINLNWDWGFRAGLGYRLSHDGWDIKGEYKWVHTNGGHSVVAGMNGAIIPLRGTPSLVRDLDGKMEDQFQFCLNAASDFSLYHRSLDVHIGRDYFTSPVLSVRPHLGVQGAWVNQEQVTRYSGGHVADVKNNQGKIIGHDLGLEGNTVSVKDICAFRGLGPMVGISSKWHVGAGFGLFANVRGALLLGCCDITHEELYSLKKDNSIHLTGDHQSFLPTAQFQLGFRYDQYFKSGIQHFGLSIGLEEQYWWKQNQRLKMIDFDTVVQSQRSVQDVAFYGLTAQVQLDF